MLSIIASAAAGQLLGIAVCGEDGLSLLDHDRTAASGWYGARQCVMVSLFRHLPHDLGWSQYRGLDVRTLVNIDHKLQLRL
jgi:hypothetical protein